MISRRSRMPNPHPLALLVLSLGVALSAPGADAVRASPTGRPAKYNDFILAAGNAETDAVRLAHLKKLAHQCTVDGASLPGLDTLIKVIERWDAPDSRLDFFGGEIRRTLSFDFGIDEGSALHPIAAFYRARMLVWTCLEYSEIYPFPEKRAEYLNRARTQFELAAKAFPENRI